MTKKLSYEAEARALIQDITQCESCQLHMPQAGGLQYCASCKRDADRILALIDKARQAEIEQCAIEAGERSPEGVSSHTMLGDMWDARIRALGRK